MKLKVVGGAEKHNTDAFSVNYSCIMVVSGKF